MHIIDIWFLFNTHFFISVWLLHEYSNGKNIKNFTFNNYNNINSMKSENTWNVSNKFLSLLFDSLPFFEQYLFNFNDASLWFQFLFYQSNIISYWKDCSCHLKTNKKNFYSLLFLYFFIIISPVFRTGSKSTMMHF